MNLKNQTNLLQGDIEEEAIREAVEKEDTIGIKIGGKILQNR